jgi:transcriptional regulator with XRE-family HTH domain
MLTGAQMRAARALVRWTVEDLAKAAKVGVMTVRRAEASDGLPSMLANNLAAIRSALEAAGVIFVEENGEGPGVRLRKVRQDNAAPTTIPLDELNAENDE